MEQFVDICQLHKRWELELMEVCSSICGEIITYRHIYTIDQYPTYNSQSQSIQVILLLPTSLSPLSGNLHAVLSLGQMGSLFLFIGTLMSLCTTVNQIQYLSDHEVIRV
jgi:hypothetical protein